MENQINNTKRILLVYATWQGSSKEISDRICHVLNSHGIVIDCADVKQAPDPSRYDAVIIGGGIRGGCFHPFLIRFIQKYGQSLKSRPVAYFIVCLTLRENTELNRCAASQFLQTLKQKAPDLEPVSVGLFGGVMDYAGFSPLMRLIIRIMKLPKGDFRDWNAIEQWALRTCDMLLASVYLHRQPDNKPSDPGS